MITPSFSLTATERVLPKLALDFTTATLDPRITFTRALNTATCIDSSGNLVTVNADLPRFDYNPTTLVCNGLLIEESRVNSLKNNTMVGAVAGAPGTAPNDWTYSVSTGIGITTSVVGTGTENGITYIDLKATGTASGAGALDVFFANVTDTPMLTGQTWTGSLYWKLQAGSFTGISSPQYRIYEYTSGIGFVTSKSTNLTLPTSAALITQRATATSTLSGGATTAYGRPLISMNIANGAAIDVTLRIGLPQLEQGAFATSVIQTSGTAVTRNADVATMTGTNFSDWFNASEGALWSSYTTVNGGSSVAFSDGTYNNRLYIRTVGNQQQYYNQVSGTVLSQLYDVTSSNIFNTQSAITYKAGRTAIRSLGGASAGPEANGTPASIPIVSQLSIGNGGANATPFLNGTIKKIYYYPQVFTNSELCAFSKG